VQLAPFVEEDNPWGLQPEPFNLALIPPKVTPDELDTVNSHAELSIEERTGSVYSKKYRELQLRIGNIICFMLIGSNYLLFCRGVRERNNCQGRRFYGLSDINNVLGN
jgi:hypothetical protein